MCFQATPGGSHIFHLAMWQIIQHTSAITVPNSDRIHITHENPSECRFVLTIWHFLLFVHTELGQWLLKSSTRPSALGMSDPIMDQWTLFLRPLCICPWSSPPCPCPPCPCPPCPCPCLVYDQWLYICGGLRGERKKSHCNGRKKEKENAKVRLVPCGSDDDPILPLGKS